MIEKEKRLEEIYKQYPRKLGKSQGMRKAQKEIQTVFELDDLQMAIANYKAHLERENVSAKYVLYFSTFMNQWRDWLDEGQGQNEREGVVDWECEARKVLEGIKRFGPHESQGLQVFLGPLFQIACKVGIGRIREMPRSETTVRKVANALKEVSA